MTNNEIGKVRNILKKRLAGRGNAELKAIAKKAHESKNHTEHLKHLIHDNTTRGQE